MIAFSKFNINYGVVSNGFHFDHRQGVHICSIGSMKSKLKYLKTPNLIVWDECFVAGTLIDGVPIEQRKIGQLVRSYNETSSHVVHNKIVTLFKKNAPPKLYCLWAGDNKIVGTYNHPVFIDGKGWVNLGEINNGDNVYLYRLRDSKEKQWSNNKKMSDLLQISNVREKQTNGSSENERKKSNEDFRNETKGFSIFNNDWSQTKDSWREWSWANYIPENIIGRSWTWVVFGICGSYKYISRIWAADSLQNRHCAQRKNDCDRSRWSFSFGFKKKRAGQEKGNVFKIARVDCVKVYEQGIDREYNELCPDGYVYNLEIENTHTYFANDILVHNCHHIGAATWTNLYKEFPNSFHIGLTATPERTDGKGLKDYFSEMILGPKYDWLIENKYLSPYKYYAPSDIDLTGIHSRMGDFVSSEINSLVNTNVMVGNAVTEYQKHCNGKRAIVFCASISHSKNVADEFIARGIKAMHVDSDTDSKDREQAINDLSTGEIKVLCNVDLFGEGVSVDSVEAVIMLRPTQSLGLFIQQAGRSLRTFPGKEHAIILDHVGNHKRHGLPDDDREWSLDGNAKKKKQIESIKICEKCFAAIRYYPCFCGFAPEIKSTDRTPETVSGNLEEVQKKNKIQFKKDQANAKTYDELCELGRLRGYKNFKAWAYFVFNSRKKRHG